MVSFSVGSDPTSSSNLDLLLDVRRISTISLVNFDQINRSSDNIFLNANLYVYMYIVSIFKRITLYNL